MRYNHFSMLPEQAFQPRGCFGMTLEGGSSGGGGGGSGGGSNQPAPTRPSNPQPIPPFLTAGGGFLGRGAPGNTVSQTQFDSSRYLQQNPDVARDPYYGQNPFHHYQDYGFTERRSPFEGFQYLPSQQRRFDPSGQLTGQGMVASMTTSPEFQRQQEYNRAYSEAFRPDYKEFGPSGQYYQPIYQSRYQSAPSFYRPSYGGFGGLGGFGGFGGLGGFAGSMGGMGNPFAYMYEAGGEVDIDDQPAEPDQGIASLLNK